MKREPLRIFSSDGYISFEEEKLNRVTSEILRFHIRKYIGSQVTIDLSRLRNAYIDGAVPLCAYLEKVRLENTVVKVVSPQESNIRDIMKYNGWLHFMDPDSYEPHERIMSHSTPLYKFNGSEELNDVINKIILIIIQQVNMEPGLAESIEWSINEIAGNILDHSGEDHGFLQVSFHPSNQRLSFIVCDNGMGIRSSMIPKYGKMTDSAAINMAIKKGITSKDSNQGNGLAGSVSICQLNSGRLDIVSHKGLVIVQEDGKIDVRERKMPYEGTLVHMSFDLGKSIELSDALWGRAPVATFYETIMDDNDSDITINITDLSSTFGNRPTGMRIRRAITNTMVDNPGKRIRIDMNGVGIMASSFADELFGKLFVELGPIEFSRRIEIFNFNGTIKMIIDNAVMQRAFQSYG